MKEDNFSTPFFRSIQDLSKQVYQMKKERQKKDPRRIFEEEGPSTSYQQQRRLENYKSPHRSTMPTFFEEGERYRSKGRNEPKTHDDNNKSESGPPRIAGLYASSISIFSRSNLVHST